MRLEICACLLLAVFIAGGILWTSFICWHDMKGPNDDAR